jgi:hypothetical protein
MIGDLTKNLINTISTVTALSGRVGAKVGGTGTDPTMSEAPVPFAWVIFGGDNPVGDTENGKNYQQILYTFTVVVVISYETTETDLLDNKFAVLEDIQTAVRGTQGHIYSDLWKYEGQELQEIYPSRLVYQQTYSIIGHHKI